MYSSSSYGRTRPSSSSTPKFTSGNYTSSYSSSYSKDYSPRDYSTTKDYSSKYRSSSRVDDISRSSSYNTLNSYNSGSLGSSFASLNLDADKSYSSLKRRASKSSVLPPIERYSSERYSSERYSGTRSTPTPSSGGMAASAYSPRSLLDSPRSSRRERDSSQSSSSKKQGGLRNIGNSCYLNSVIQCVLHCDPLKEYLLRGRHKSELNSRSKTRGQVADATAELLKTLLAGQTGSPSDVKRAVTSASGLFRGTAQEDAQEFLRWYLEALHEDVSRVISKPRITREAKSASEAWSQYTSREDSTIVDLCVGQLKSSLTCSSCGYVSEVWDPFWDLSVPIPSRARDIKDCLNEFQREEVLDGSEKPKCERCKTRRRMTKKFSIEKCPKVLVIHLKRFGDSVGYSRSKISTNISFPLRLTEFGGSYSLRGVCNHSGGVGGGHYIAYGKTDDGWFEYNDSRVSSLPESSVQSRDAYLLFYTK